MIKAYQGWRKVMMKNVSLKGIIQWIKQLLHLAAGVAGVSVREDGKEDYVVKIEAKYLIGEYDMSILSAKKQWS